jgi:hypothetical protein
MHHTTTSAITMQRIFTPLLLAASVSGLGALAENVVPFCAPCPSFVGAYRSVIDYPSPFAAACDDTRAIPNELQGAGLVSE